jgi:hypothetical protein
MNNPQNKNPRLEKVRPLRPNSDQPGQESFQANLFRSSFEYSGMKLIPWRDIWSSLTVARIRGNGEMIEVFYETLFKEAVFDDRGAWSMDLKKRN